MDGFIKVSHEHASWHTKVKALTVSGEHQLEADNHPSNSGEYLLGIVTHFVEPSFFTFALLEHAFSDNLSCSSCVLKHPAVEGVSPKLCPPLFLGAMPSSWWPGWWENPQQRQTEHARWMAENQGRHLKGNWPELGKGKATEEKGKKWQRHTNSNGNKG